MAKAMTGIMDGGGYGVESADHKGVVVIEWPSSVPRRDECVRVIPGCFVTVHDDRTGRLIPAASATVHVAPKGLITADVAVYLDDHGEIIYDLDEVAKSDATPATFPFLVAEMRTAGQHHP
jgi:hypothetical protein